MKPQTLNELLALYREDPDRWADDFGRSLLDYLNALIHKQFGRSSNYKEDLVGEVSIKVFENLPKYDPSKSAFSTWVANIFYHTAIDHGRKEFNAQGAPLNPEIHGHEPLKDIDSKLTLKSILDKLPKADKSFVRDKLDGLSNDELAKKYGLTPQSAKQKYYEIRKKLVL